MYKNLYKKNSRCLILFMAILILSGARLADVKAQEVITETFFTNLVLNSFGVPIADVTVTVKGSNRSTTTSDNGTFVLDFIVGDVLTFSHKSFLYHESKVRDIDLKKGVIVHLSEQSIKYLASLPGPYREDVDKASFLGAASTIYSDQITKSMGRTIIPALTGRMAGLNIIQNRGVRLYPLSSGDNHNEFTITTRGLSPVVMVDGVQSEFFALDMDMIESASLQKDALSSMFMGMQSSRGVLFITTKRPTQSALHFSYTSRFGVTSPIKIHKPLDSYQYAYLLNEALENDGRQAIYSADDFAKFRDGSSPYTHPNVNWFDSLMNKTASTQSHNFNVMGGNNAAQFIVGLGYMREEGLFKTSPENTYNTNLDYQRFLITSKVNINVTDDFTANVTLIGRIEDGNQPGGSGGTEGYRGLIGRIFTTPNLAYPIRNPDGSWGGNVSFINNLMSQTINAGYVKDNARDILGTVALNYDFDKYVKGLSVRAFGSIASQVRNLTNRTKVSQVFFYSINEEGLPTYTMFGAPSPQSNSFSAVSNFQDMYGQLAVNYNRRFGVHGLRASIKGDTRTLIEGGDLPQIPSNVITNIAYDYENKYFVQTAVTESYYNRYAPENRWGKFYAFGLGWDLSGENFMKSADWLNQLKLRAVYGRTGLGITNSGYYGWRQTFGREGVSNYPLGTSQSMGDYTGETMPLANYHITWEKADKINTGLDMSILNNRLQFTIDYYNDYYFDLLQLRGKSIELMGATYPAENIGEMRRYGTELSLTYQNRIGRFNYYITANWNYQHSKVLFIDEQEQPYDYLLKTGKPDGLIWGLVANGFLSVEDIASSYPVMSGFSNIQPGDVKYVDTNGDGVIDEFDRQIIGGDKPLSFFGLDMGFEYRGFELSILCHGVYNRDIYINNRDFTEGFLTNSQHFGQAYEHLINRWTPETAETATIPRLSAGGNSYNNGNGHGTSLWLKSGNFIRLKNVYVAYNIPEAISRQYLSNIRVKIFAGGQNLFTASAFNLVDPEVLFTNYPIQRNINFGINVKF